MSTLHAHTPAAPGLPWHPLSEHAAGVAAFLRPALEKLGCPALALPLAVLHDAGKSLPEFQQYLEDVHAGRVQPPGPPHAPYGALLAWETGYRELLNVLRGHHAGLVDAADLKAFLGRDLDPTALGHARRFVEAHFPAVLTRAVPPTPPTDRLHMELQTRLLLSALADSDYLDTERHRQPRRFQARQSVPLQPAIEAFWQSTAALNQRAPTTRLNTIRREIFDAAVQAAAGPTGIYQLTTPTGGGKTRASLAFSLEHAARHGLERVIVAAPFNSITTQTARVIRDLLGGSPVLEHHSSVPPERLPYTARLASENWDAPVIVTSFVQLLESLHSAHPSRVRKLHRLARSVIVLDEVQAVPVAFTGPVVGMLEQLATAYGSTVLLCTATPPAVHEQTPFLAGFRHTTSLLPPAQQAEHFAELQRVTYQREEHPVAWSTLAERLARESQTLTVLNTRRDALALLDVLKVCTSDPVWHLSTLQCSAHRADVLQAVTVALKVDPPRPVHLVSTQVIEAGVDIDFPFVARALGPLPSLIQTAGRCNREFRQPRGTMLIFEPAEGTPLPGGEYRHLVGLTRAVLSRPDGLERLDDPGISESFYRQAYRQLDTDARQILGERERQNFARVEHLFTLIEDDTLPVHVDYGPAAALLDGLPPEPSMEDLRRLGPYTVGVPQAFLDRHLGTLIREVRPGLYRWMGEYDKVAGLRGLLDLR